MLFFKVFSIKFGFTIPKLLFSSSFKMLHIILEALGKKFFRREVIQMNKQHDLRI